MISFILFTNFVFLQRNISCLSVSGNLIANYKLAGDFKDFRGVYGDVTNNGTSWTTD